MRHVEGIRKKSDYRAVVGKPEVKSQQKNLEVNGRIIQKMSYVIGWHVSG
jgi:hypothetical protein